MVGFLENLVFRRRIAILILLGLVTVVMGYFAAQLRMDAELGGEVAHHQS